MYNLAIQVNKNVFTGVAIQELGAKYSPEVNRKNRTKRVGNGALKNEIFSFI